MVWDIRSGQPVLSLPGHHKSILSSDFSDNGYQLATGSQDNTVKIWDLRRRAASATLPIHSKLISDVRFQHEGTNNSSFLLTSSYDGHAKVISCSDYMEKFSINIPKSRLSSVTLSKDREFMMITSMEKNIYRYVRSSGDDEEDDILGDSDFLNNLLNE